MRTTSTEHLAFKQQRNLRRIVSSAYKAKVFPKAAKGARAEVLCVQLEQNVLATVQIVEAVVRPAKACGKSFTKVVSVPRIGSTSAVF